MGTLHLRIVGKPVIDFNFIFVVLELFSLSLTVETLWAEVGRSRRFSKGSGSLWVQISEGRERRPPTTVGVIVAEWLPFRMVSKYPQCIIYFCHNPRVWQTDRRTELQLPRPPSHMLARLKLENVSINYVLPLKAACLDAVAIIKCFLGPRDTSDLISMSSFTFSMRRHLIQLVSAPPTSFRLEKFGWLPFGDLCVQPLATKLNVEFTEGG